MKHRLLKEKIGQNNVDNIIINTVCPILFAYGVTMMKINTKDKSLKWLEQTAAENNSITKVFRN
jgi:hypothetical protein